MRGTLEFKEFMKWRQSSVCLSQRLFAMAVWAEPDGTQQRRHDCFRADVANAFQISYDACALLCVSHGCSVHVYAIGGGCRALQKQKEADVCADNRLL